MRFLEELKWRGLIKDVTDIEALEKRLEAPITCYCGFDPTADSLHIGHLQQVLLLRRYQMAGHRVIALCGGATGMIGDPRPTSERQLLSLEQLEYNVECLKKQLSVFLDFSDSNKAILENNYKWLSQINILEYLRDYGKFFNVNNMIHKDIVASRLSTGISYTEFSYTILQAIDWLNLYEIYNCEMQIGGSDQWGNLTSGTELIRKVLGDKIKVFGVTSPLIMKSDGSKFGKSEGGNIWLDPNKTGPYEFYQFLLNTSDADVIDFLKRLSFKSIEEITELENSLKTEPHLRLAQKALAAELTEIVHTSKGLETALKITSTLFGGNIKDLTLEELKDGLNDAPKTQIVNDTNLVELLVLANIASSKRDARELITNNSIAINGEKTQDLDFIVSKNDSLYKTMTIIKKGKKHYFVILFE